MLRVQIHINQTEIIDLHAQRMEGFKRDDYIYEYHGFTMIGKKERTFMGKIMHNYSKGAEELAVKLLRLHKKWWEKGTQ